MKSLLIIMGMLLPIVSRGIVLVNDDDSVRTVGEKVYFETKDKIEVPDEDVNSAPRYRMGKEPIPVSMADVIRLADEYFQKTLKLPFSEEGGFVDVNLSWTGSLGNPLWWYHVRFKPHRASKLVDPNRWDYQLAILMNGKVYPSVYVSKELVDSKHPLKGSGIPILQNGKRSEMHVLEKEMKRLAQLPNLKSGQKAGVYLGGGGEAGYIFYPDGCFSLIQTREQGLYKIDKEGRVYSTYVFGDKQEKISDDQYIGVMIDGKFVEDQGDYQNVYHLKEVIKKGEGSNPSPKSKSQK
jgi:hypothetical protein